MIQTLVIMYERLGLDGLSCLAARWREGFKDGDVVDRTTHVETMLLAVTNPLAKTKAEQFVTIAIMDESKPYFLRDYYLNDSTRLPLSRTTPIQVPYNLTSQLAVRAQLGPISGLPARTEPYFSCK
ncbi:hypothetical protein HK104_006678 [Borealophlyctis nickersoniae]|nr:hypothetical protein HK104_006678 [Borealophlyctis nickersoniae]